mmetsp:Transcript_15608/g.34493  ORF Transcript_15608/g.34493 Transcript_15608/m.34493 type:complete len:283 (-) Transcript_15608:605-1453(-)
MTAPWTSLDTGNVSVRMRDRIEGEEDSTSSTSALARWAGSSLLTQSRRVRTLQSLSTDTSRASTCVCLSRLRYTAPTAPLPSAPLPAPVPMSFSSTMWGTNTTRLSTEVLWGMATCSVAVYSNDTATLPQSTQVSWLLIRLPIRSRIIESSRSAWDCHVSAATFASSVPSPSRFSVYGLLLTLFTSSCSLSSSSSISSCASCCASPAYSKFSLPRQLFSLAGETAPLSASNHNSSSSFPYRSASTPPVPSLLSRLSCFRMRWLRNARVSSVMCERHCRELFM